MRKHIRGTTLVDAAQATPTRIARVKSSTDAILPLTGKQPVPPTEPQRPFGTQLVDPFVAGSVSGSHRFPTRLTKLVAITRSSHSRAVLRLRAQ